MEVSQPPHRATDSTGRQAVAAQVPWRSDDFVVPGPALPRLVGAKSERETALASDFARSPLIGQESRALSRTDRTRPLFFGAVGNRAQEGWMSHRPVDPNLFRFF